MCALASPISAVVRTCRGVAGRTWCRGRCQLPLALGAGLCAGAEQTLPAASEADQQELLIKILFDVAANRLHQEAVIDYIERWLTAPFETTEGTRVPRERATPQGGVVSPILMNLFMHYACDVWMKRSNPSCPFARYADDPVVHCRMVGDIR